jgi:hypothetical protein
MGHVAAQPLRYAVVSAVTAIAATTAAIIIALGQDKPGAAALGFSFGISFAPHSALVAMPVGAILGALRARMGRLLFVLLASLCAAAMGMLLGRWVVGDGNYFPESLASHICITWTLAALVVAAFAGVEPEPKAGED